MHILRIARLMGLDVDNFQLCLGQQGELESMGKSDHAPLGEVRRMNDPDQRLAAICVGVHDGSRSSGAAQSICALGFHRQHRARRMAHDFLDQSLDAGSAMGRQDDELGAEVFAGIEDRFKRIALANVVANFRPFQDVVMAKLLE